MVSKLVKIKFIIPFTVCCSLQYYSCGSKGYEIEQVEMEVPADTQKSASNWVLEDSKKPLAYENPDPKSSESKSSIEGQQEKIKENLFERNIEKERTEIRTTNKGVFTIQIGAFIMQSNAMNWLSSAKGRLSYDVSYKLVDGLYKVRAGEFASRSDALNVIDMIRKAGFGDAFIIVR